MINLDKRMRIIVLMILNSFVVCGLGNGTSTNPSHNINGPNHPNPVHASKLEPEINDEGVRVEIPQILMSDSPPNNTSPDTSTSHSKLNFTDNSRDAFGKLKALISTKGYAELFGKNMEDIQASILASINSENNAGSVSQQSQSRNAHQQPTSSKSDMFFYSSNHDKHTSQNCYIVKMKSSVEMPVLEKISEIFGAIDAKIYKKYKHGFIGYSICFPDNTLPLALLKEIPSIEFVERDLVIKATQIQENAPWGLARLSSPDPKSSYYSFDGTGEGVSIYVIDSGLEKTTGKNKKHVGIFIIIF